MIRHRLTFITPLFSKGSYDDRPEIRPASIRGQLHWWFRALGGSAADENAIFGSVHSKPIHASKIVVRVGAVSGQTGEVNTLPHKQGGQASPKWAYKTGATFDLIITERLGGLSEAQRKLFDRTIRAWLLGGSLGLRTTRGGGAIHWVDAPPTSTEFRKQFGEAIGTANVKFDLLDKVFNHPEDARRVITETIAHPALEDARYPLGAVRQGKNDPAPSRKTSPLRLTVRKFDDGYRILALWDQRTNVTGNTPAHLRTVIERLANGTPQSRPTEIGRLLKGSTLF